MTDTSTSQTPNAALCDNDHLTASVYPLPAMVCPICGDETTSVVATTSGDGDPHITGFYVQQVSDDTDAAPTADQMPVATDAGNDSSAVVQDSGRHADVSSAPASSSQDTSTQDTAARKSATK